MPSLDMTPWQLELELLLLVSVLVEQTRIVLRQHVGGTRHTFFSHLLISASAVCLLFTQSYSPLPQSSFKTAETYMDFLKFWLVPWVPDSFSLF